MEKLRVLAAVRVDEPGLRRLREQDGVDVEVIPLYEDAPPKVPSEQLADKHVFFGTPPSDNARDLKSLRWMQIDSVGYEHVVPLNLPARGVRVSNAAGVFDAPIGEWNVAMMINLARDLPAMFRNQQRGAWDRAERFQTEVRD